MKPRATVLTGDVRETLLAPWRTNCQVTAYLVERLPAALWDAPLPAAPRRTVRMLVGHLHNARSGWIKVLGREHGIVAPALVDSRKVARRELLAALRRSGQGIESILDLGISQGGQQPPSQGYVRRNLPLDVGHVLTCVV